MFFLDEISIFVTKNIKIKNIFPYSGQISDLQVKTNDENVPGHPHHQPGSVLRGKITTCRPFAFGQICREGETFDRDKVKTQLCVGLRVCAKLTPVTYLGLN